MTGFLSDLASGITPYVPGEQPADRQYIKLNTNENPYGPAPGVQKAIEAEISNLRLYPDPECSSLRRCIAEKYGVSTENVFVGNGSDEVLAFAFPAFFTGGAVLFPNITYSFYPVYADLFQTRYVEIPLRRDFSIDIRDYETDGTGLATPEVTAGEDGRTGGKIRGILIPNPNAPTGVCLGLDQIEKLAAGHSDKVVLIDEAYIDFGGESAAALTRRYENLLVVMTLSKSRSLAGLRVGFAIGSKVLIDGLNTVKNSFNSYTIDRLAMAGAEAAIRDEAYFRKTADMIVSTRERVADSLIKLGFDVVPSKANFLFISHPSIKAAELFKALRERGILVRYFNKPLIDDRLRVTIGTDGEMDVFLEAAGELARRQLR